MPAFAKSIGVQVSTLGEILEELGITPQQRKFANNPAGALSAAEQQLVSAHPRIKTAPHIGEISLSAFATSHGLGLRTLVAMIDELEIETPERKFFSITGRALSQEGQSKLLGLIAASSVTPRASSKRYEPTPEETVDLITNYNYGKGLRTLSKERRISVPTVKRVLLENGVELRLPSRRK